MVICIQCDEKTKSMMDSLVSGGSYRDYGEVVSVAVQNLFVITGDLTAMGAEALIYGKNRREKDANPGKGGLRSKDSNRGPEHGVRGLDYHPNEQSLEIPAFFRIFSDRGNDTPQVLGNPTSVESKEQYYIDEWIFGQYNKLLPMKASCRALLSLKCGHSHEMDIEDCVSKVVVEATKLGDVLSHYDEVRGNDRDSRLALAFPKTSDSVHKSQLRYGTQFVGSVNKKNELVGMLADYLMAGIVKRDGEFIRLTKAGLEYALLENPVLDTLSEYPNEKFSEAERSFLLDHIKSNVPVEYFAFKAILNVIESGSITPGEVDKALEHLIQQSKKKNASASFIASQRSGAISRMADLMLISRRRHGVNVHYHITDQGARFVAS